MLYVFPISDSVRRIKRWEWASKRSPSETRKIFRNALVTAIALETGHLRSVMIEIKKWIKSGDVESLMIDSGGFQVLKKGLYTPAEMIRINCELYTKYDFADSYVLPDCPPILNEPLESTKLKIQTSIESALKLFDILPERVQKKCIPVFHIRDLEDLDRQEEAYRHIIELSNRYCFAPIRVTASSGHRLSPLNIDFLTALMRKTPSAKTHVLGIGSRKAMYCLDTMGVDSCDSTSPIKRATNHEVIFGFDKIHSDNIEEMEKGKEISGHECSSCDDLTKLKESLLHRFVHNFLFMEDLQKLFNETTPEKFVEMFPDWSDRIQTKSGQMAFF